MPSQVDPRYFDFGGAFLGGIEQAHEKQRQQAMFEMQQQQAGLQQRQFGLQEKRFAQEGQQFEAEQKQQKYQQLFALASNLDSVADNPQAFEQVKAQIFSNPQLQPLLAEFRLTPEGTTPQNVRGFLATARGAAGQEAPGPGPIGSLYQYEGAQGPVYGTAAQAVGQTPYRAPPQGATGTWSQPVEVTGPDGKPQLIQTHSVTGETRPVQGYRPKIPPSRQGITPKDATVAKNKINIVKLARQQLSDIRRKFEPLKNSVAAGPFGAGKIPTEAGNAFDRSVDRMRSTLTALTRVPGVGAMSDYETRLDQAKFPNRGDYESVTADSIEQLDAMLNAIETGYTDLLSGGEPEQETQTGGWSIEPAP